MKTIRIFLSVMAFVIAIGGSVASSLLVVQNPAFEYVDNPDPIPDACVSRDIECQTTPTSEVCRLSAPEPRLRENNTSTTCGVELWKTNP